MPSLTRLQVIRGLLRWLSGKAGDTGDMVQSLCRVDPLEKEMAEDEKVGWHHRLNGHEFEQILGVSEGQGSLACCSPRGCKESDTT